MLEQERYEELVEWDDNYIISKGSSLAKGYNEVKIIVGPSLEKNWKL